MTHEILMLSEKNAKTLHVLLITMTKIVINAVVTSETQQTLDYFNRLRTKIVAQNHFVKFLNHLQKINILKQTYHSERKST